MTREDALDAEQRSRADRPAGLPASVRLPAEVPDNLWPPPALLEPHPTEVPALPASVEPPVESAESSTPDLSAPDLSAPDLSAPDLSAPDMNATVELETVEEHTPADDPGPEPEVTRPTPEPTPVSSADTGDDDGTDRADDDDDDTGGPAQSRTAAIARHAAPSPSARRTSRRRRRAMLAAYAVVIAVVLGAGHQLRNGGQPPARAPEAAQPAAEPLGADEIGSAQSVAEPPEAKAEEPEPEQPAKAQGNGEFRYAKARGPMLGTAGPVHRFKVAVEETVDGTSPTEFAEAIEETLGDDRSWVNDGRLRMRRVPKSADNADFTIYLASARTSEQMCAAGGLHTEGFTSCRVPGKVIINADRWDRAVPDYDDKVAEYRRYAINHEVGHELGHGHEECPGEGKRAPVMMPQTYGLQGCTRNAWPYLDGKRYSGEPMR